MKIGLSMILRVYQAISKGVSKMGTIPLTSKIGGRIEKNDGARHYQGVRLFEKLSARLDRDKMIQEAVAN
jgi:hypothetical protein